MFVKVEDPTANRATLSAASKLLERFSADLDAEVLEPGFATDILSQVCRLEKLCAGIKTLVSLRATAASDWKAKGERSAAHWLARRTGKSVTDAATLLETAQRVNHLPRTQQALKTGTISEDQAKHIASAAGTDPKLEGELLNSAASEGFGSFVQRCNKLKAAGCNQGDGHRRIYARRYLRKWTDPQGAFRLDGCFTPEHGAQIWAALAPYRHQAFEDARACGVKAPFDAYAADALLAMSRDAREGEFADPQQRDESYEPSSQSDIAGSGELAVGDDTASRPHATGHDEPGDRDEAASRSHTSGEPLAGGNGPQVPFSAGATQPKTAIGSSGKHSGTQSATSSGGRRDRPGAVLEPGRAGRRGRRQNRPPVTIDILVDYNALIRGKALPGETCEIQGIGPVPVETVQALQNDAYLWVLLTDGHDIKSVSRMGRYISPRLRKALFVRDRKCVVPGCDVKDHLQIDHRRPVSQQGPTALDNLALLCRHHHDLKTYHGFELSGRPGDWSWRRRGELAVAGN